MNTALTVETQRPGLVATMDRFLDDQVRNLVEQAHITVRWHRKNFQLAEATAEQHAEFNQTLPWLIRLTRMVHSQMLDPEFPHTHLAEMTAAALWQLQQAWECEHPAQPVESSDKILAHLFPDEP